MSILNQNRIDLFYTAQKAEPYIPPIYFSNFKQILAHIQISNDQTELDEHARKLYVLILDISTKVTPFESKKLLILASTFFDVIDALNSMDIQYIFSTYKQLAFLYVQEQKFSEAKTILTQVMTIYKKLNEILMIDQMDQTSSEWHEIQSILHVWHFFPDGILSHYPETLQNVSHELQNKLFYDAYHGNLSQSIVEYLSKCCSIDSPLNEKDKFGNTLLFYAALNEKESFLRLITSMLFFRSMPLVLKNDHDHSERKGHVLRLWTHAVRAKETGDLSSACFFYTKLYQLLDPHQTPSASITHSDHYLLLHSCLMLAQFNDHKNNSHLRKHYLEKFFTHYNALEKKSIHTTIDPFDLLVQRAKRMDVYGLQHPKSVVFSKQGEELAREYGFDCINTAGGGACFFHAVLDQLKQQKSQAALIKDDAYHTSDTLREIAIAHITQHADHYLASLEDNSIQQYIEHAKESAYWADHQLILALARTLNLTIVIFSTKQPDDPIIIKTTNAIATVFLVNHHNMHFESLIKNPAYKSTTSIEALLEEVNVDAFVPIHHEPLQVQPAAPLQNTSSAKSPKSLSKQCGSDAYHSTADAGRKDKNGPKTAPEKKVKEATTQLFKSTREKQTKKKSDEKPQDNGLHRLINFSLFDKSSALKSQEDTTASVALLNSYFGNEPLSKKPKR